MLETGPLTRRFEVRYDKMVDRKIIQFIEMHPSHMGYIKSLIMADYKRYLRNPTNHKKKWGIIKEEAPK